MICVNHKQQKISDVKNINGSLLFICLACDGEVANGRCGHRAEQPPCTSESKNRWFCQ